VRTGTYTSHTSVAPSESVSSAAFKSDGVDVDVSLFSVALNCQRLLLPHFALDCAACQTLLHSLEVNVGSH
jgi:hypothetical protein